MLLLKKHQLWWQMNLHCFWIHLNLLETTKDKQVFWIWEIFLNAPYVFVLCDQPPQLESSDVTRIRHILNALKVMKERLEMTTNILVQWDVPDNDDWESPYLFYLLVFYAFQQLFNIEVKFFKRKNCFLLLTYIYFN